MPTNIRVNVSGAEAVGQLNNVMAQYLNLVTRVDAGQDKLGVTFKVANGQVAQFKGQIDQLIPALAEQNRQVDKGIFAISNLVTNYLKFRVVSGVVGEVVGLMRSAVQYTMDLEVQLARINRVLPDNMMGSVKGDLQAQLSRTGSSVKDLGEAYYQLGTFIKSDTDLFSAVNTAMNLVVGTQSNVKETTRAMLQIHAQFNDEMDKSITLGEQYRRIGELLAGVHKRAAAEMDELTSSMKYFGPIAEATHMRLAETMAVTGIISEEGLRGRQGGTGLGQMASQLVTRYNKDEGGIVKGGNVYHFDLERDQNGMFLFEKTLRSIREQEQKLAKEDQPAFERAVLGTTNAFRTFGTLGPAVLDKLAEETRKAEAELSGITHEADKLKDKMTDTLPASMGRAWNAMLVNMGSAWESFAKGIHLEGFFNDVRRGAESFTGLGQKMGDDRERFNAMSGRGAIMRDLQLLRNLSMNGAIATSGGKQYFSPVLNKDPDAPQEFLRDFEQARLEKMFPGKYGYADLEVNAVGQRMIELENELRTERIYAPNRGKSPEETMGWGTSTTLGPTAMRFNSITGKWEVGATGKGYHGPAITKSKDQIAKDQARAERARAAAARERERVAREKEREAEAEAREMTARQQDSLEMFGALSEKYLMDGNYDMAQYYANVAGGWNRMINPEDHKVRYGLDDPGRDMSDQIQRRRNDSADWYTDIENRIPDFLSGARTEAGGWLNDIQGTMANSRIRDAERRMSVYTLSQRKYAPKAGRTHELDLQIADTQNQIAGYRELSEDTSIPIAQRDEFSRKVEDLTYALRDLRDQLAKSDIDHNKDVADWFNKLIKNEAKRQLDNDVKRTRLANQQYSRVYDHISDEMVGDVVGAYHGRRGSGDILKNIGGTIVDENIGNSVRKYFDPFVTALTASQLATTGNTEALNANTVAHGGKIPAGQTAGGVGSGTGGGGGGGIRQSDARTFRDVGAGLAAYNMFQTGAQNGVTAGGVIGSGMAGASIGAGFGPGGALIGAGVGIFSNLLGGLFGGKKHNPMDDQQNMNPSYKYAPSDFDYYMLRARIAGSAATDVNDLMSTIKNPKDTAPTFNVFIDGVKSSVKVELAQQTSRAVTAPQTAYMDFHSPVG